MLSIRQHIWKAQVRTSFRGNRKLEKIIREGVISSRLKPGNPYSIAFSQFGRLYRRELRDAYDVNMAGGWPPIKKRTKQWRRRKYGIEHELILFVTETLYGVTEENYDPSLGHFERKLKYGMQVGVTNDVQHPDIGTGLATAIRIHAAGRAAPKMPKRNIWEEASRGLLDHMSSLLEEAHEAAVADANDEERSEY